MNEYRVIKSFDNGDRRLSGTACFPSPSEKDIGRIVVCKRVCITWNGFLGYFTDDPNKTTYAFHVNEVERVY